MSTDAIDFLRQRYKVFVVLLWVGWMKELGEGFFFGVGEEGLFNSFSEGFGFFFCVYGLRLPRPPRMSFRISLRVSCRRRWNFSSSVSAFFLGGFS